MNIINLMSPGHIRFLQPPMLNSAPLQCACVTHGCEGGVAHRWSLTLFNAYALKKLFDNISLSSGISPLVGSLQ